MVVPDPGCIQTIEGLKKADETDLLTDCQVLGMRSGVTPVAGEQTIQYAGKKVYHGKKKQYRCNS